MKEEPFLSAQVEEHRGDVICYLLLYNVFSINLFALTTAYWIDLDFIFFGLNIVYNSEDASI